MTGVQEFDFSVRLTRAILWQYEDAANLRSLLEQKNDWYAENQTGFWQDWLTDVFDLRTANQFGLAVWGYILGLKLYVNTPPDAGQPVVGFNDPSFANFDNGNFGSTTGSSYLLPVATQRIALQLRYAQLTGSGTVPETNRLLARVFGGLGAAYLLDYGNMHQQYVFDFPLTADLIYLFNNYDVLPRPAGVESHYIDGTLTYFGFNSFNANFDNGNFGA